MNKMRLMRARRACGRDRESGAALVEFALTLPILITVVLGLVDLSRAIQFDNILTHMSREGANLAARVSDVPPPQIINVLASTAAPMDMSTDGMIYISKITGVAGGRGEIEAQYRASNGNAALGSRLWACPTWRGDGTCNMPGTRPTVALSVPLRVGESIWAVETRYDYSLLTRYLFRSNPDLYAITVL